MSRTTALSSTRRIFGPGVLLLMTSTQCEGDATGRKRRKGLSDLAFLLSRHVAVKRADQHQTSRKLVSVTAGQSLDSMGCLGYRPRHGKITVLARGKNRDRH